MYAIRVVEGAIPGGVLTEDERLEEPCDMGAVPLGRAHIRHRLHGLVFCAQDRRQAFGGGTHTGIGVREVRRRCSTAHLHEIRPFATPSGAVAHAGCTLRFTLPRCASGQARSSDISCSLQASRWMWPRARRFPLRGPPPDCSAPRGLGPGARPLPLGSTSCPRRRPAPGRGWLTGVPVPSRDGVQARTLLRKLRRPNARKSTPKAAIAG